MADTVKIPGIGPLDKKYAIIGAAGVAGFVGYAYWRNRQSASDAGSATDTTDTSGLEDANASASDWGSAYGDYGDGSGYAGGAPIYTSPISGYPQTPTGSAPTSDPEWNQKAIEFLEAVGVEAQAASHATSRYLANLCLTDAESDYVRQAIAGLGEPPQSHHSIQICPPAGNGGSSGDAPLPAAPQGLHGTSSTSKSVNLAWFANSDTNTKKIRIYRRGVSSHIAEVEGTATTATISGLKGKTTYYFHLRGVNASGKYGPSSNEASYKTK